MQNLAYYISANNLSQVKALVASDPSLIVQICVCPNGTQATPLAYAIGLLNVPMIKALLEAGDSKNHKYTEILTKQLVAVVKANSKELLKLLLVHGAELNGSDTDNAFFTAAKEGHTQMLDLMLDYGASINMCDTAGFTVLMRAVEDKRLPMVNHLLKKGAPVNFMNKRTGQTALFRAAEKKMPDVVELLLQKGASVTEADYEGDTVLMKAIQAQKPPAHPKIQYNALGLLVAVPQPATPTEAEVIKTIELLIHAGADMNARNETGTYALHLAVAARNYTALNLLIANGADLDVQFRKTGHTALRACFALYYDEGVRKMQDAMEALLDHGANPDLEDHQGDSVLSMAVQVHDTFLVQDLLRRGAKLSGGNKWLDYAATNCSGAMVRVLQQGQIEAAKARASQPKQSVIVDLTSDQAPNCAITASDNSASSGRKSRSSASRTSNPSTGSSSNTSSNSTATTTAAVNKAVKKEAAMKQEGDTGNTWLAPLLTARLVSMRSVRLCEDRLVRQQDFSTEEVFASLPAASLTTDYFGSIGIAALGLQQHLIAVHGALNGVSACGASKGKSGSSASGTPSRGSRKQKADPWADAVLQQCALSSADLQTSRENLYDVHATEESFLQQDGAKLLAHLEFDVDIGNAAAREALCRYHIVRSAEVKLEDDQKSKKQRK